MGKFQKIVFWIFVIGSLALGYFGYKALKNTKQPSLKAINLIPDSCELLLSFDNYSDFTNELRNKNLLWQDLQQLSSLKKLAQHFHYFDSIVEVNQILSNLSTDNPIHCAFYKDNKYLIACNVKELSDEKQTGENLEKIKNSLAFLALTYEIQDGVICLSNSQNLTKKYFSANKSALVNNKSYALLVKDVNYNGTKLFLQNNQSNLPLKKSYSNISLKPDKIILNGMKLQDTSEFLGDLNSEPLRDLEFMERIPLICNAFEVFAIGSAQKLFSKQMEQDWWTSVNDSAMFNAKNQFYANLSEKLVKILMPSKMHAIVLDTKDSLKISEIFPYAKDSTFTGNSRIIRLKNYSGSFSASTFPQLKLNELNFAVQFANYMVFTATESDAEIFVNASLNNSSVLNNNRFKQFASRNFDDEFHYLRYAMVSALSKEYIPFGDYVNDREISQLKNIGHCSFIAKQKNNVITFRYNLGYLQESISDEPNVLWTLNADTTIISKPFLFKNHTTKGNEIVFQTATRHLYLQNATGKTVWKKPVNEKIESDIFVVDAFKNGKLQMLFNTKNFLHLIDRNGNYVQGYPVKLPSAATNKLSVFDYENKNDQRLFIACADKKIYNYSIWGIKQEGFKPLHTASEVTLPIKYCKVGLSDYLITADRKGNIYAFSRKGEGRIDFKNKLIEEAEDMEIVSGNSLMNTQVIYYDKKGHLLNKISLNDKKEIHKVLKSDIEPANCFFDFDKNKISDLVLAYGSAIEVFDMNGSKIFGKEFEDEILSDEISCFRIGANTFMDVFSQQNAKSLINIIEQKTVKEFKSTSPARVCNLFNDGKAYVLVIYNNELKCIKL